MTLREPLNKLNSLASSAARARTAFRPAGASGESPIVPCASPQLASPRKYSRWSRRCSASSSFIVPGETVRETRANSAGMKHSSTSSFPPRRGLCSTALARFCDPIYSQPRAVVARLPIPAGKHRRRAHGNPAARMQVRKFAVSRRDHPSSRRVKSCQPRWLLIDSGLSCDLRVPNEFAVLPCNIYGLHCFKSMHAIVLFD